MQLGTKYRRLRLNTEQQIRSLTEVELLALEEVLCYGIQKAQISSQLPGMHDNASTGLFPFSCFSGPTICGVCCGRGISDMETGQSEHGYVIIVAALATRLRFLQLRRHELHHQLPPVRHFDKTFLSAIVPYAPILQTPVVLSRALPDQSAPMQALQTTAIPNTFNPNNRTPNLHILNRYCSNL